VLERLRATCVDTIERIDYGAVSVAAFVDQFVKTSRPVIIKGIPDTWKGRNQFTWKVGTAH
jgi:hypothetical protein